MGSGVTWVGTDRHLKGGARLVELVLAGVEHGQVVVGLRQLRVILGDLGKGGDRVTRLARFGLDHTLDKAHLRVARFACQVLLSLGQRFG